MPGLDGPDSGPTNQSESLGAQYRKKSHGLVPGSRRGGPERSHSHPTCRWLRGNAIHSKKLEAGRTVGRSRGDWGRRRGGHAVNVDMGGNWPPPKTPAGRPNGWPK